MNTDGWRWATRIPGPSVFICGFLGLDARDVQSLLLGAVQVVVAACDDALGVEAAAGLHVGDGLPAQPVPRIRDLERLVDRQLRVVPRISRRKSGAQPPRRHTTARRSWRLATRLAGFASGRIGRTP